MIAVHTVEQAFNAGECEQIIEIVRGVTAKDAGLVGQATDHNLRRADLVWLDDVPEANWVTDRIVDVVRVANREMFDFDLREFAESPQVARYGAEREGHFGWHSDIGDGPVAGKRKLTMVAQLSEPDAYEGGMLEVQPSANVVTAPKTRGSVTLFPSFLLHRVVPVTKGERYSLTIWAHGPVFR
ncbi:MAG: 2OG-Fe(II) oxygenase [Marivivens sp.]|nr:2OG-Fe(II) oxygenase [Marivivens sp.]